MPLPRPCRVYPVVAAFSAVALGVGLSACSTTPKHTVRVTAAANPDAKAAHSYTLAGDAPGRSKNDSFHAEVAQRIHTALMQRGLYEALRPSDADIIVSFDYGEHPPQTKVTTVTEPVFTGNDPMGTGLGSRGGLSARGSPLSGSPYPSTGSGVVMVETVRVTTTSEKYLRIEARENTSTKQRVWSVDANVEDESTPITDCIPAMVDAVIEYIGYTTREPQNLVIKLGPDGPSR
jgi:hypothetical protein